VPQLNGSLSLLSGETSPNTYARFTGAPQGTGMFSLVQASDSKFAAEIGAGLAIGWDDEPVAPQLRYESRITNRIIQESGQLSITYAW